MANIEWRQKGLKNLLMQKYNCADWPRMIQKMVESLDNGSVLLENTRFHKKKLKRSEKEMPWQNTASYGEVYVNDAFGTAHRSCFTASIVEFMDKPAVAGF